MAIREILTRGESALTKVCHPVTKFDQKLWDLIDDMKETLAEAGGVGLAAPQVGILRRVVIVINEADEVLELVKPRDRGPAGRAGRPGGLSVCARPVGLCEAPRVGEVEGPGPLRQGV